MASRNVPSSSMREDDGDDDEIMSFTRKIKPKPFVNYGDRMPFRGGNIIRDVVNAPMHPKSLII